MLNPARGEVAGEIIISPACVVLLGLAGVGIHLSLVLQQRSMDPIWFMRAAGNNAEKTTGLGMTDDQKRTPEKKLWDVANTLRGKMSADAKASRTRQSLNYALKGIIYPYDMGSRIY